MPKGDLVPWSQISFRMVCILIYILLLFSTLNPVFANSTIVKHGSAQNIEMVTNNNETEFITLNPRAESPDWPMFGKDQEHSHLANPVNRGIYQPSLKWDKWTQISGNGIDSRAITIGNFTNNINWPVGVSKNVKHVVYADDGMVKLLDGGSGDIAWELDVDLIDGLLDNDFILTTPTLGNFNANSDLDMIIGTTDGKLYMYEPSINYDSVTGYSWSTDNINQDKKWSLNTGGNFTRASAVLGKLDNDNYPDIVIGTGNHLFAVSGNQGSTLWNQRLPGMYISTPVLYKDGSDLNTVVTTLNQTATLNYSASFFNAKSTTGNRLDVIYYDVSNFLGVPNQLPSPTVAELDGNINNDKEIIICTPFEGLTGNGKVYVYHTNRNIYWSTPDNTITGQIEATPAVADLNNDGTPEIIVISWRVGTLGPVTHIYAFNGNNGTLLWHVIKDTIGVPPIYANERAIASPLIVDINTDNTLDVVFTTSPNIYAIDGKNGTDIWDISLVGTGRELWSTPAAADIDNDGFLDVVAEGAAFSQIIIDLTIKADDLSFSTKNITENQPVTIKAIIHNNGKAQAEDIKVSFYENNILIGNDSIGTLPGDDSREVRIDWTPKNDGKRIIKVIIDPLNSIEEINEKNNNVEKEINVIASYPDLLINKVDFFRGDGKQVDNENLHLIENENSTVKIFVQNIGGDEGKNIKIRFLDNGNQVGLIEEIKVLKPYDEVNLTYTWHPVKGTHDLNIKADFSNSINELNESNNEYIDKFFIKSKVPSDASFIARGIVNKPDGKPIAISIDVIFTNNRTGSIKSTKTDSTGHYSIDLQTIPGKYYEGDDILIFVSDGENETKRSFAIYSEDLERFDNLTLVKLPTYAVSISVDSGGKIILPNEIVKYNITVENRGNEYNTVSLSLSDILNVKTNEIAEDWEAYLNDYMVEDIPPKQSLTGVILTIKAPLKNEDAEALDQVLVAVTAKSINDETQTDIVGITTTVGRLYNFKITIQNPVLEFDPIKNTTAKLDVNIKNQGNDDDTVEILVTDSGGSGWVLTYEDSFDLKIEQDKDLEINLATDEYIESGEYTFTVSVRSIDGKGESIETFKVRVVRPDLRFSNNVTMNPIDPKLGQQITFNANVYNNGTSKIADFYVEFRIDESLIGIEHVTNLSANSNKMLFFTWTPKKAVSYLLEFIIDPYGDILEENKDNNKISFTLNFNLDVAILKEPVFSNEFPKVGERIEISVTVENVGNVDINQSFLVSFYDGDPDSDGELIASYNINEQFEVDTNILVSVQWKVTGADDHDIYVVVNPDFDFQESNYDNNQVSKSILVLKGSKTVEPNDYTSWIIFVILVILILIIIALILSPTKQLSAKRKREELGRRTKSSYRKTPRARYGASKPKNARFIVLNNEDIIDDTEEEQEQDEYLDKDDEKDEIENVDEDDEYNEDEDHKFDQRRRYRNNIKQDRRRKKRTGILAGLFSSLGGSKRKRRYNSTGSRIKMDSEKTRSRPSGQNRSEGEVGYSKTTEKPKRVTAITKEEIAEVKIIGIGDLEVEPDDEESYNDVDGPEPEEDEKKKKDIGWEYSQLIGIR